MDIKKLIGQLTLEEKAAFCSGADGWHTEAVGRLGIPAVMMTDGPHGLRKVIYGKGSNWGGYGEKITVEATCFPTASCLANSWNVDLLRKVGAAIAKQAKKEQVSIVLGPGINMKRSPTCGRNFEYFSEDPYLAGKLAAAYVNGAQAEGVGTSLKHFAANNQETRRHSCSSEVDMRTLREIYLAAFETVVKEAQPATIMHSYNPINGKQVSQSKWLLNDILREEWGYKGVVISDWNAVNDRVKSLEAGCDLEMPWSYGLRDKAIVEAVRSGELDEKILDRTVERILNLVFSYPADENAPDVDLEKAHEEASKAGDECMVLLKNERNLLPLSSGRPVAVIGAFAKHARYQGGGSSHVNNKYLDDIYELIDKRNGAETFYAEGYRLGKDVNENDPDEALIAEAVETAKKAGRAIIIAGLPDSFESEGADRKNMAMPESHNKLIRRVTAEVKDTVVVLLNGSPVELPWLENTDALLAAYLGGEALGGSITRVLFGDVNPSGKLAETYPVKYEDTPAYLNYPGEEYKVVYAEGVYIGYRYYQKKKMKVAFPFGFGLSYTTFDYSDIKADGDKISVKVTNTGKVAGKEIVQLYVGAVRSRVSRPVKELKRFAKIDLAPGESKTVEFELDDRCFAYWDERTNDWRVDTGDYNVYVGRSSEDTPLCVTLHKVDPKPYIEPIHVNLSLGDLFSKDEYKAVRHDLVYPGLSEEQKKLLGDAELTSDFRFIRARHMWTLRMLIDNGSIDEKQLDKLIAEANRKLGF